MWDGASSCSPGCILHRWSGTRHFHNRRRTLAQKKFDKTLGFNTGFEVSPNGDASMREHVRYRLTRFDKGTKGTFNKLGEKVKVPNSQIEGSQMRLNNRPPPHWPPCYDRKFNKKQGILRPRFLRNEQDMFMICSAFRVEYNQLNIRMTHTTCGWSFQLRNHWGL